MANDDNTPNLYQLQGAAVSVSYSTTSIDGRPRFTYQDAQQMHSFSGDEIRTDPSEIGTLVTVTLREVPDLGRTTFTLLLPRVRLDDSNTAQVATVGITAMHRASIAPVLDRGQTQTYRSVRLTGTARSVLF